MRHLLACNFSSDRWLLAVHIFHDLRYTNLASNSTYKIKFEQHPKQKTANILIGIEISIRNFLNNKNSDTPSYDVTNAMT